MENKLQELTDKLYNEGLSKGRQEAEALKAAAAKESEQIISDARKDKESEQIISDARKEAERILETARKEAEELRTRVEGDIRMASSQTISALRQQIENIIITKAVSPDVKAALADPELVKSLVTTVAKAFNAADPAPAGLEVILPSSMQKELGAWFKKKAAAVMGEGVTVTFSRQMAGGFKIGPADGSYRISFADGDFENILTQYLRPATRKLLFG